MSEIVSPRVEGIASTKTPWRLLQAIAPLPPGSTAMKVLCVIGHYREKFTFLHDDDLATMEVHVRSEMAGHEHLVAHLDGELEAWLAGPEGADANPVRVVAHGLRDVDLPDLGFLRDTLQRNPVSDWCDSHGRE